ncbi:hypothetical protein JCM10213_008244 [Rhodosporidiobolus nylandii]
MSATLHDLFTTTHALLLLGAASLALVLAEPKLGLLDRVKARAVPVQGERTDVKVEEKPARMPDPDPLREFPLETAKTRDHIYVNKCIRYPYFQTMSHRPMEPNHWIEIDSNYRRELEYKAKVIAERPEKTVLSLPENDEACAELLMTVIDYLPKRYPTLFAAMPNSGIYNKVTDEVFAECAKLHGTEALMVVSRLVVDDFLMGKEREDGHVYFVGGVVAIPGFYDFSAKIGKSMYDVHAPVPHFNEKILMSVERTLKRFKPNEPFERSSWEIVDDYQSYHHAIADLDPNAGDKLREDLHPKDYIFRIDHQTFRKLPNTNGIIFGVHPILRRLETFADLPLVPALLATVHENAPEDLMKYKLAPCYQEKMLPYLKELTQSQINRGLIKGDEDVSNFRDLVAKA